MCHSWWLREAARCRRRRSWTGCLLGLPGPHTHTYTPTHTRTHTHTPRQGRAGNVQRPQKSDKACSTRTKKGDITCMYHTSWHAQRPNPRAHSAAAQWEETQRHARPQLYIMDECLSGRTLRWCGAQGRSTSGPGSRPCPQCCRCRPSTTSTAPQSRCPVTGSSPSCRCAASTRRCSCLAG